METYVYADILFLINFSMDYITLWISAIITSRERSAKRMCIASAIGGIFGVICVVLRLGSILTYILAAAVSILMCITAFGRCGNISQLAKQSVIIWGCGALLGGTMTSFLNLFNKNYENVSQNGNVFSLIAALSVAVVYVTVRIICAAKSQKAVTVKVVHRKKEVNFTALCDSGNLMRDPLGGEPVIPVSHTVITKLLGKRACEAILSLDTKVLANESIHLRIIPFTRDNTTGIEGGFVPDSVTVTCKKQKKKVKCVLSPRKCSKDYFAGHAATLPTSLLP